MAPTEWSAIARLPSRSPGGASWCPHDSVGRHVSGFRCPETDLGYFSDYPTNRELSFPRQIFDPLIATQKRCCHDSDYAKRHTEWFSQRLDDYRLRGLCRFCTLRRSDCL